MTRILFPPALLAAIVLHTALAQAADFSGGQMTAVPVKDGKSPQIDGDLADWDLSAAEPATISEQTARQLNTDWALMYDDEALYIGVRVSLPNRPYENPNNPTDAFWRGNIVQLRLAADPSLEIPLNRQRDAQNERIAHISLWKNSETGKDYLHINRGTGFNLGQEVNPDGSSVKIRTNGTSGYIVEARLPWAALKVPGGKNPFKAGQKMPFIAETLWPGGDQARVTLVYRNNPGTFAFNSPHHWGRVEFAPQGLGQRRRPTLEQIWAKADAAQTVKPAVGVPFTVMVPDDGLKVSINIFGPKGEVLRELIGGETHPKGPLTVHWDGKDAWGHDLKPGNYRWGALFHRGLKAEFAGSVGTSGATPYPTLDGKGAWGGDHSDPIDCAADASGMYFLWPVAEAGRPVVKVDYAGRILWRKNPFVGGGFGPFFSIASDSRFVYLTLGDQKVRLVRLDAATGELLTWGEGGPTELPLYEVKAALVPRNASPVEMHNVFIKTTAEGGHDENQVPQPDPVGLAVREGKVYVSSSAGNRILVADAASGKVERELSCPGPRGLCFDGAGNLFAVSYTPGQGGKVLRYAGAQGIATPVVQGLEAPFDAAVGADGRIYVSDLGNSHQVKVFDTKGSQLKAFGKAGGRRWQGKYDAKAFLNPAGLAVDAQGGLLVVESSLPKVISRLRAADGRVEKRWFGPGVYWNSTWPMPEDPQQVFYTLTGGFGRGKLVPEGQIGVPDAYWAPEKEFPGLEQLDHRMPQPETVRGMNGELYLVRDSSNHAIFHLHNDLLQPLATWRVVRTDPKQFPENKLGRPYLKVWIDANGDGLVQSTEESLLTNLADGKPLPEIADQTSSLHMEPNGDLYFVTQQNSIVKIPSLGFAKNGMPRWNLAATAYAVPVVLPGLERIPTTQRTGILGVRLDTRRDLYTVFNTAVPGKGTAFDYPTPEIAVRKKEGLGHTSRFNVTKFAKFDPQGNLLWMAGRKATAGAKTGEIYHAWNLAGLVNDRYVASGSEWGPITFYSHDGFYVDSLMNNPAMTPMPGPYTFGGETSGGRVEYFPKRGEVWAYSSGMAYRVRGFKNGVLEGESRVRGIVELDKNYTSDEAVSSAAAEPLQLVSLTGQPMREAASWANVPVSRLSRDAAEYATAQLGYDDKFVYARFHVSDTSPNQNGADSVPLAFKGGDTVGFVLGADAHARPAAGDVRVMVAMIGGRPRLIGMKALTAGAKQPFEYFTPSAGTVRFEFVGEIPGGQVELAADADGRGYTALLAVPKSFVELDLKPGSTVAGDIEVRFSGAGGRGLQVVERRYLFTPSRTDTTMTDDVPTEARLYPQYWGAVRVK